ncbi:MAG: restriction endonuclease subunit S [Acidobacteriota bacterium]|nr:restriction endonuclease subunit S [Acidobacteriota bacterium]
MPLGEIATIEREAVEAQDIRAGTLYVGLENIEPGGRFVNVRCVEKGELASNKFRFTANHVLYGKLRPYLAKIARPDFTGICSTDIVPILPGPNVDRRYLTWMLLSPGLVALASSRASGANLPRIAPQTLASLEIPLVPVSEQRRIADILDKADALRAKRRAALAQLDTLTKSIFLDMFGDPATNPRQWRKVTLGSVAEVVTGFAFNSDRYVPSAVGIRLCRGANVLPGRVDWSDLACWPIDEAAACAAFSLDLGDIVLAMDRPWVAGGFKIAQIRSSDTPALLVQRVARIRGRDGTETDFLFHLLRQPSFSRHCRPTETTVPHISPLELRSFAFPYPPSALQRTFTARVRQVAKLVREQESALLRLDALFASLQHRAFRGEL